MNCCEGKENYAKISSIYLGLSFRVNLFNFGRSVVCANNSMYIISRVLIILCSLFITHVACSESVQAYLQNRNSLVEEEVSFSLAGQVTLNDQEMKANNIFFILNVLL